ncbi:MAG TPA: hypothetical protein VI300_28950 [Solirubrobacter sp.]
MSGLTGSAAVDVAIGLAFVFLLFSVLCSAVQELIAGVLDLRSASLEKGLRNLLDDGGAADGGAKQPALPAPPAGEKPMGGLDPDATAPDTLSEQLLAHGLIRTMYRDSTVLFRRKRRGPSYIPSDTFAVALLDLIAPASDAADPVAAIRAEIEKTTLPAGTKSGLLALAGHAGADRDKLRKSIEQWFDATMDRVSGWYKRKTQIIICALSLLVTIGLNVNTVNIADRLIHDDSVRAALVQRAVDSGAKAGDDLSTTAKHIEGVQELGIPIGWNKASDDPARADLGDHPSRTLLGWLLTFIALSLGAPFWFDALSKLAGLRNAGGKPEKATA